MVKKMNDKIVDKAEESFSNNVSDRERAAFELGIKLGALFHISMGIPISKKVEVLSSIEKALQDSISCQPYVSSVSVKLPRDEISEEKKHQYDYTTIVPENLKAEIIINFKNVNVKGNLEWNDDLNYPLMYISEIHDN